MMLFVIQYSGIGVIRARVLLANESLQYPRVWHRSPGMALSLEALRSVGAAEIPLWNGSSGVWACFWRVYTGIDRDTLDRFSDQIG